MPVTVSSVVRVCPMVMTSVATIVCLLPIMAGSEVMQRIAAPMIGGMTSTPVVTLLVLPVAWLLWHRAIGSHGPASAAMHTGEGQS